MGNAMTMTQKLLAAHCGRESVSPGELIEARLDLVLGNDITSPVAIKAFENAGAEDVFDKDRIVLVLDHFVPNKDIKAARQSTITRDFAKKYGITHFYDVGKMGIEHCLLPEQGLVGPGDCMIGADSHTCTYGALGCFSTGVGSTDMAAGLISGKVWLKVPSAIKIIIKGKNFRPESNASGKDIILQLIGMNGVDGANYRSMEFCGEGLEGLNIDDRFTIANMAVEMGAKNCIFPVDDVCKAYCAEHFSRDMRIFEADADAKYDKTIELSLEDVRPVVAMPSLPSNVEYAKDVEQRTITIQQAVIGSCTNGRLSDLRKAAEIMKGKHVAKNVRCIVIPGTQKIWLEAMHEGLFDIFIDAGAVISTPTCGPCLGGYMGILDKGERAISTTNRNFTGRMGHPESEVILASPATAAASAIAGIVCSPESI